MRVLSLILLLVVISQAVLAQSTAQPGDLPTEPALALDSAARQEPGLPPLQSTLKATEQRLYKAFRNFPTEETARDYYYFLLNEGQDLEAGRFRERNSTYTFALPPHRRGFESIYAELGLRTSANRAAGNIYNAGYGGFFRVSAATRIWHSISYLQQDDNLGHYKQGEYFSGLYTYLGKGWYLKPALHYIYTGFTATSAETAPVEYLDSVKDTPTKYILYRTRATENTAYVTEGRSHYVHIALPVTKRYYQWSFEASPSLQWISTKAVRTYSYTATGTTDSSRGGRIGGSKPYYDSGSGTLPDTAFNTFVGQLGGSIGYRFNAGRVPVFIRAGAWYLLSNKNNSAAAWNMYALVQGSRIFWLHLSFTAKGSLPFALASDGLYFNQYHIIKARPGITAQLFPLKHWSPMLTYQYEQQERYGDDALLVYHALYFTLKYNL